MEFGTWKVTGHTFGINLGIRHTTLYGQYTASLEPSGHHWNVTSLSLLYRYYFGRCLSELAQPLHFLKLKGGLLVILIDRMIFLSPFLDVTRMSISTVSFPAQLDSGILFLKNAFHRPMISMALSLELADAF